MVPLAPTASTAPGRARGRSTSRTGSSPGRRSRPTTPRPAPTSPSTSPAAARAVRPSAGTPTARPGCATPTSGACCWSSSAPPSSSHGDPVVAWGSIVQDEEQARRLQDGARQGRPGPRDVGRGGRDHRRGPRLHGQALGPGPDRRLLADPGDVAGLLRLGRALPRAHRRPDAVLLRLVRRPAQRLAADVRRPDRRARVRRLVGRRLPDHVGLQRPDDAHPGRALDDRGALPRPEGRRRRPRLRREREVRRRVGQPPRPAPTARSRWRWATSCSRSSSSTSRSPFFTDYNKQYTDLPHLICLEPTGGDGAYRPGKYLVAGDIGTRRAAPRTRCGSRPSSTPRTGEVRIPQGSIGHRFGEEGWGRWNLELGDIDPALTHVRRPRGRHPRVRRGRAAALRRPDGKVAHDRRGVPVRAGRRPPRDHRARPDARPVRRRAAPALPGRVADAATTTRPTPATPAWQEEHTGRARPPRSCGSPASGRRTRSTPRAAA